MTSTGPCSTLGLTARLMVTLCCCLGLALACVHDESLEGKPCQYNHDCNIASNSQDKLSCQDGVCGDPDSVCGNAKLDGFEQCDDGNLDLNDACIDCRLAECGDGVLWFDVEECDDGNVRDDDACLGNCTLNTCGDGLRNPEAEECDDGNEDDGDGCSAGCALENPAPLGGGS